VGGVVAGCSQLSTSTRALRPPRKLQREVRISGDDVGDGGGVRYCCLSLWLTFERSSMTLSMRLPDQSGADACLASVTPSTRSAAIAVSMESTASCKVSTIFSTVNSSRSASVNVSGSSTQRWV